MQVWRIRLSLFLVSKRTDIQSLLLKEICKRFIEDLGMYSSRELVRRQVDKVTDPHFLNWKYLKEFHQWSKQMFEISIPSTVRTVKQITWNSWEIIALAVFFSIHLSNDVFLQLMVTSYLSFVFFCLLDISCFSRIRCAIRTAMLETARVIPTFIMFGRNLFWER